MQKWVEHFAKYERTLRGESCKNQNIVIFISLSQIEAKSSLVNILVDLLKYGPSSDISNNKSSFSLLCRHVHQVHAVCYKGPEAPEGRQYYCYVIDCDNVILS